MSPAATLFYTSVEQVSTRWPLSRSQQSEVSLTLKSERKLQVEYYQMSFTPDETTQGRQVDLRSKAAEPFISAIIAGQQAHLPNNILMPPHSLWLRDLLKGPSPLILSEWPSSHGDEQQLPLPASHHTSTHQLHSARLPACLPAFKHPKIWGSLNPKE